MKKKSTLSFLFLVNITLVISFADLLPQTDTNDVTTVVDSLVDTTNKRAVQFITKDTSKSNTTEILPELNDKELETEKKESGTSDEDDFSLTDQVGIQNIKNLFKFEKIIGSLIVLLVGFYFMKFVTRILQIFAEKSTRYRLPLKGTIPIVRLLGWSTIVYIIVGLIIKPPFETLIALSASLGIAVGLAGQDLIKNIFGGIMILFDRPFQVGDKIQVGENYGEVISIGLRSTRIVTADDSKVIIPNSDIMNHSVSNSNSGEPNCQVVAEVFLPIDVSTVAVRDIALEVARVSKYVYLNKPINVLFFNEIKEKRSFLKMRLKAYVLDIRYEFDFKSEMTELIIRELIKNGFLKKEDVS
jgi:small-conductance mechanosensitive channel